MTERSEERPKRDETPTTVLVVRTFSTAAGLHQEGAQVTLPRWKADLYCKRANPIAKRLTPEQENRVAEESIQEQRDVAGGATDPTEQGKEDARREQLRLAVQTLDHTDDAAWTERGEPQVAAVNAALLALKVNGDTTSRAELRHLVANEVRQMPSVED